MMSGAATAVLSIKEARDTSRLMFLERPGAKDIVLEFRSFKKDGSAIEFVVLDRPVSKAEDRLPDDMLAGDPAGAGTVVKKVSGYQSSAQILALIK